MTDSHTHRPARSLSTLDYVQLLPAVASPNEAIVFVHGYGGSAMRAWAHFETCLPGNPSAQRADLFFYGYDALHGELFASAVMLRNFLNSLLRTPETLLDDAVSRPDGTYYDTLLIVAHSIGAVITRWAVGFRPCKWRFLGQIVVARSTTLLAHNGAFVVKLALAAFSGFRVLHLFAQTVHWASPLTDELSPHSECLSKLEQETRLWQTKGSPCVTPALTVLAHYENVVLNGPFAFIFLHPK